MGSGRGYEDMCLGWSGASCHLAFMSRIVHILRFDLGPFAWPPSTCLTGNSILPSIIEHPWGQAPKPRQQIRQLGPYKRVREGTPLCPKFCGISNWELDKIIASFTSSFSYIQYMCYFGIQIRAKYWSYRLCKSDLKYSHAIQSCMWTRMCN